MNIATINPPHREPNGRLKRLTQTDKLNELNRIQAEQETLIVRMQPHRRDLDKPESPLAESALGRFVLKHKLREEFYTAGIEYAVKKAKWQSLVRCPLPERILGNGGDTPCSYVAELGADCLASEMMMVEYGTKDGMMSVLRMARYEEEFAPGASIRCAILSLAALSYRLGKIDKLVFDNIIQS